MPTVDDSTRADFAPLMEELGWTLHTCQSFEFSLTLLLSLLAEHRLPRDGEEFQAFWQKNSRKSLGRLFELLKAEVELSRDFEEFILDGVKLRNFVIHNFFRAVGKRIIYPKERLKVLDELREARADIVKRDKALEPIIDALLEKYDISTDSLKQSAGREYDFLNFPSANDDEAQLQ